MKQGIYLGIDTEFTGHHPHKHGLTEIALIVLNSDFEEIAYFESLISPPAGYQVSEYAMKVNTIDLQALDNGLTYSELIKEITRFVRKHFVDKPILFGHFITMDFAYLNYIFDTEDKDTLFWKNLIGYNVLDTKVLINTINLLLIQKGQEPMFSSTSLSSPGGVADTLGIRDYKAHTALADIRATREVLIQLLDILHRI